MPLALLALLLATLALALRPEAAAADHRCGEVGSPAGPYLFNTYEAKEFRKTYTDLLELAAFNRLFPGDPYFGLPPLEQGPRTARTLTTPYIPPILLKATAWIESAWMMAQRQVLWGNVGPTIRSHACAYGLMQIVTGMQNTTGTPTREQLLTGSHYAYNIARGARILVDKWNGAPELRPVVGQGNPRIAEDWYFAVWSYNGFAWINHPLNPRYSAWPRTPFSCGPRDDGFGHDYSQYPFQEMIFGCAARPPRPDGVPLWQGISLLLPDLANPQVAAALNPANFVCQADSEGAVTQGQPCFNKMDIPTPCAFPTPTPTPTPTPSPSPSPGPSPSPSPTPSPGPSPSPSPTPSPTPGLCVGHSDPAQPTADPRTYLGAPVLVVEGASTLRLPPGGSAVITIRNAGTGILPFMALSSQSWLKVEPWQWVALGGDLGGQAAMVSIRAEAVVAAASGLSSAPAGQVRIEAPTASGGLVVILVEVTPARPFRSFIPGVGRD